MDVVFGTELTRYSEATNRLVRIIFYFANFSIIFYFTTSTSSKYPSFHSKWNKSIIHCCFSWSSVNYNRSSQQSRRFVVFGTKNFVCTWKVTIWISVVYLHNKHFSFYSSSWQHFSYVNFHMEVEFCKIT